MIQSLRPKLKLVENYNEQIETDKTLTSAQVLFLLHRAESTNVCEFPFPECT